MLVEAAKSLKDKEINYNLEIDNSFGMGEKIAKKIGVNFSWLNKLIFKIMF
ncbi:hypothetical protein QYB59_001550 [Clostridium perfringens]|nr:hypothetical protein [Clostridium perfringens]